MTEPLSRTSALAERHRALGSALEDWNGMGTAWTYASDPRDEHDAVREAAGLFDMSPLKKVRVRGPDALAVVNHVATRDLTRIPPGKSAYGAVLTETGTVADDAIAANLGDDQWLFVHGSGGSMELLRESGRGKNVSIEIDSDLHDLALQGPKALALLDANTPADLAALAYFHHLDTEVFGHRCIVSRTGYSGERGYEIFLGADAACDLWDQIVGHGEALGIRPASFTALDKVRIEAALLFYGYDMTDEHTPWEAGLGWSVHRDKADFRGRAAALASEGKERFHVAGIAIEHNDALTGGEALVLDAEPVGTVNSPAWSHRMGKSLALVHLAPHAASPGTLLEVSGESATYRARVETTPFYDGSKTRTHAGYAGAASASS